MFIYLSKRNSGSIDEVVIITLEYWVRLVFYNKHNISLKNKTKQKIRYVMLV